MPEHAAFERGGTAAPLVPAAPRFIGRDQELAVLAAGLAGPPAVVLIDGEAGVGKTRLLREYLATQQGTHKALVATCPPFRQPQTLGPVADALRQAAGEEVAGLGLSALGGALRPLFPEWAADLQPAPEPAGDPSEARHQVFAALAELVGRLEATLLVVEDVHWADEATLEFLLYLASTAPRRVSLVVTCRAEEVPAGSLFARLARLAAGSSGLRLALAPLDAAGTAGLVSSMLDGQPLSDGFSAFMHDWTEGLPLAIEESVRLMSERADLNLREGQWVRHRLTAIAVPLTVCDTVLERAAWLGPDAQAVLRAAAVLADPVPESTLAAVAALPAAQARDGLIEGLESRLLGEDDRGLVTFRHALARQAVLEDIPGPERRIIHARAGQVLQDASPPPAARLARHFREARDTGRWCRYAEEAGDLALATGDEVTAAVLLHGLITGADLPPGEVARLASKIVLLSFPGDEHLRDLVHALRAALGSGELPRAEEAGLRFHLGRTLFTMGEHDAGRAELEQAVRHLPPDSLQAARAMMLLGWPQNAASSASVHLRWLSKAARVTGTLEPAERLRLDVDRATVLLLLGEESGWTVAAELPAGQPGPTQRLQIIRAHGNIGEAALIWGRYRDAAQRLRRGLELAGRYGYPRLQANCLVARAQLDWFTGCWAGLIERADALASDEELGPGDRLRAELVGALLRAAGGETALAAERLQRVTDGMLQRGAVDWAVAPAAALARLRLAEGAVAEALKVTDEPAGIVARKGTWIWAGDIAPVRASALVAAGRTPEAVELVAAFARGIRGRKAPAPVAGLALCRAILAAADGNSRRAAGLFAGAAAAWQELPRPYDALLAREQQALSLLAAGKAGDGVQILTETCQGLSDLGARGDSDRLARVLRGNGADVAVARRRGRPAYGDQLSPREAEVVRLVAEGMTNRQIAAVLVLSHQTVASHLHSAMRKLRVSSRTALAVTAIESGVVPQPECTRPEEDTLPALE